MNEIDAQTSDGPASNANLGVINGIYLVEDDSSTKVKEEMEEDASSNSSELPNFLNSNCKIKEEIQDSDDVHLNLKEEPMAADEDGTVASCFEFVQIKGEAHEDIAPRCKNLEPKETSQAIKNVSPTRGRENSSRGIKHDLKSHQLLENPILPSCDIQGRLAHELPLKVAVGGPFLADQPECKEEMYASLEEKSSPFPTPKDLLPPTRSRNTPKERLHKCLVCLKEFTRRGQFNAHFRVSSCKRPFGCDVCQKAFAFKSCLITHMRTHTGEKPYKCSVCSKGFKSASSLRNHKQVHTEEKPHKCSVCSEKFKHTSSKKRHEQIHTGEKPYKCSVCSKGFNRTFNLRAHEQTHIQEKPHICSVCSKGFHDNQQLEKHMLIHTEQSPHKCPVCLKTFSSLSSLRRHKPLHTGDMPHKCLYCSKGFCDISHLKIHERIHTGEKPFQCSLCPQRFIDNSYRRKHERSHGGKLS